MLAAHDGNTRSNAAANITRVEDRNRVPAHPKNHRPMTMMSSAWNAWLLTSQPANITGYGHVPTGAVPAQNEALAALYNCQPIVLTTRSITRATSAIVTHRPQNMLQKGLRMSLAPRTSP